MKQIAENLYEIDYRADIMPGVCFPVRTTVVKLSSNHLMIISPGPGVAEKLNELLNGQTEVLVVSPNLFHNAHVEEFYSKVPHAKFFGPAALEKKGEFFKSQLRPLGELKERLGDDVAVFEIVLSPSLLEWVFYHPETKSLVVTDLCFNMREKQNLMTKILLKMVGAYQKIGQSKLVKLAIKNRSVYLSSLDSLKGLTVNRVVVGHGGVITGNQIAIFWKAIGRPTK